MGFFSKIKEGLKKTRTSIGDGFNAVFSVFKKVDEDFLEELLELLIMADVGYDTSERIIGELRKKAKLESLNDPESVKNALAQIIAEAILSELGRGVTFLHGQGAFTRKEKNIAMAVVNLTQIAKVKLIAHTIDPTAFMIIISANEVEGPGFSQPGRKILDRFDAKRDEIHAEER